jgi:hypothetical protein
MADTVVVVEQDDVRFEISVPPSLAHLTDEITAFWQAEVQKIIDRRTGEANE